MTTAIEPTTILEPAQLPDGFTVRAWRDDSDFEKMRRVIHADKHSQGLEESTTAQDLKLHLQSMQGMDIERGIFLVEKAGLVVAYKTLRSYPEANGTYCYNHHGYVLPEYKKRGIGRAMIRHSEAVLRRLGAQHPSDAEKTYQVFLDSLQTDLVHLLEQEGYAPVRYFYTMLRPDLENIPDVPLPDGLELRPAKPEHLHPIWEAMREGFRGHWGETEHTEEEFHLWLKRPFFQPELWQIAWDDDRVVAVVLNTVDEGENREYHRKRGFTEDIATLKEYRGRGIAQALITQGLKQFRELGMTEAALDVDTENNSGALRLYEKLGYRPISTVISYRKPFSV